MKKWEVLAMKSITNTMEIQIVGINDDKVKFRKATIDSVYKVNSSRIRYDKKGNPYFMAWGCKEYFLDYMNAR